MSIGILIGTEVGILRLQVQAGVWYTGVAVTPEGTSRGSKSPHGEESLRGGEVQRKPFGH